MKKLTLIMSDLVVLYGSLILVLLARYGANGFARQYQEHIAPFTLLFTVWLLALYIANLYEERTLRNDRDFYERLVQAVVLASLLSVAFFYLTPSVSITPRANLFLFIIAFSVLEAGIRTLLNRIIAGGSKKHLLIVGTDDESLQLARFVTDNPQLGYAVSALVRLGQESLSITPMDWPLIDDLEALAQYIHDQHIAMVVISPQAYRMNVIVGIFYRTLDQAVDFISLASFTEQLTGAVPLGAISQEWFLDNIAQGSKKSYETFKRGVDAIGAIILGLPMLVVIPIVMALVRLDSAGPVFFRQRRTGRNGQPFDIIKFRTMRINAEESTGAVWAQKNDPRITRIGRFLRKTRIDELPQLWNILIGQMSFVGPRAERPEFDEQLAIQIPFYNERYLIKPGLSGWAQINYPYGASPQDAMHKLQYDLYYIKHRSLALDLEIILKTINISLRRAGR